MSVLDEMCDNILLQVKEINLERVRNIKVSRLGSVVYIDARDLRELLFLIEDEYPVPINSRLLYDYAAKFGVLVDGFHPNKTNLRTAGMSCKDINKILPGSFPSEME